jgi:hypothetical protein
LPVLPHHESQLNRLTNCPSKLRETFFLVLEGCIRSIASKALPSIDISLNQLLQQCFTSVDAANYCLHDTDNSRRFYNHLVYCQSLILLAAASDRPAPGIIGSTTGLLGRISACIADAGINDSRTLTAMKEQDLEVYQTARRVYWTALIIDRFHASSQSTDMMIRRYSGKLSRDDYSALGEVGYHLARKCGSIHVIRHQLMFIRCCPDRRSNSLCEPRGEYPKCRSISALRIFRAQTRDG